MRHLNPLSRQSWKNHPTALKLRQLQMIGCEYTPISNEKKRTGYQNVKRMLHEHYDPLPRFFFPEQQASTALPRWTFPGCCHIYFPRAKLQTEALWRWRSSLEYTRARRARYLDSSDWARNNWSRQQTLHSSALDTYVDMNEHGYTETTLQYIYS